MVDFEMFLQQEEQISTPAPITANIAQRHYNGYNRGHHHIGRNNHHHNHDSQSRNNYNGHYQTFPNNKKPASNNVVICQYCENFGHTAKQCYKINGYPNKPSHPTAHVAQTVASHSSPPSWFFDFGASHHIINDMRNLSIKEDYHGSDNLQVANGKGLAYKGDSSARIE
ncbi:unnamed protein product [Vicia faba]|uniref:CCHC-type domain-containing protein n=1 Tax=Vicia faba TaxID=3906 RepID=A0AAV0YDH5_VICFA|nr:unnamed protein product [Vicia faba]